MSAGKSRTRSRERELAVALHEILRSEDGMGMVTGHPSLTTTGIDGEYDLARVCGRLIAETWIADLIEG